MGSQQASTILRDESPDENSTINQVGLLHANLDKINDDENSPVFGSGADEESAIGKKIMTPLKVHTQGEPFEQISEEPIEMSKSQPTQHNYLS